MAALVDEVVATNAFLAQATEGLTEEHANAARASHCETLVGKINAVSQMPMDAATNLMTHVRAGPWTAPWLFFPDPFFMF